MLTAPQRFKRLLSGSVAGVATLDLVLTAFTSYRGFLVLLSGVQPATDGVHLYARPSTDGGGTFPASSLAWLCSTVRESATPARIETGQIAGGAAQWQLTGSDASDVLGNAANEHSAWEIVIQNQTDAALHPLVRWSGVGLGTTSLLDSYEGRGRRAAAQDTDAIRFLFSAGNIAAARYALYGFK